MSEIKAEIIADSISSNENRITTLLLTYPRMIHSEFMTHRMFSRNSASSRAIPFDKMVEKVENDPFIPIAWQRDHKGMQGSEYWNYDDMVKSMIGEDWNAIETFEGVWRQSALLAISQARYLFSKDVTKQLCNRLLEPFMWHQTLVTATDFDNWFELRCPKYYHKGLEKYYNSKQDWIMSNNRAYDTKFEVEEPKTEHEWFSINQSQAEIHIQLLAESMFDAMNESEPQKLEEDEFHIPFNDDSLEEDVDESDKIKIAVARAARLSYNNFDGEIDYNKDLELYEKLFNSGHATPFEHIAVNKEDNIYYANFKGFKSLRKMLQL